MMQVINPLYEIEIKISKYAAIGSSPEQYVAFVSTPIYGGINTTGKDIEECLTEVAKFLDGAERFRKATEDKKVPPATSQLNTTTYNWKPEFLEDYFPLGKSKEQLAMEELMAEEDLSRWNRFVKRFKEWLNTSASDEEKPYEGEGCPPY